MDKNFKVIGLHGKARAGKDTFADMLLACGSYIDRKVSFAAPLKAMLEVGLGLIDKDPRAEQAYGKSYRYIAQTLGTEWGRELIHPDIWLVALEESIRPGEVVIISDVRFENEAEWVRKHGVLIHIIRPQGEEIVEKSHASEAGVRQLPQDMALRNTGTLKDMRKTARNLYPILQRSL